MRPVEVRMRTFLMSETHVVASADLCHFVAHREHPQDPWLCRLEIRDFQRGPITVGLQHYGDVALFPVHAVQELGLHPAAGEAGSALMSAIVARLLDSVQ